jgi:ribosomal-protein-alanine N-acetyltransferase
LANEHRAGIIFLEVRPSNLAAIALYETAGFRRVAVRRNYYPAREGREDAVVMTLRMDEEAAPEAVESPGGLG